MKLRDKLDKFTKEWNANESNRDKTFTVFNQLTATKEEIQDSLQAMIERDGKIEVSLAKGEQLKVQSHVYKKRTVEVKQTMKWRARCYQITLAVIVVTFITLIICWFCGLF